MNKQRQEPRILGFLCNWCCYTAADSAGVGRYQYPPNLRVIRIMCTGRLDPSFPLEALAVGADGVFVGGCHPGECHYQSGNYHALISGSLAHEAMRRIGVRQERLLIEWASAAEGPRFVNIITEFTKRIAELGPLGQAEGVKEERLRQRLLEAANAARDVKLRTGLINAAKDLLRSGDFSRKNIASIVRARCERTLSANFGTGGT
ncbi:hydrogenase iron-sulfur subunit [Dissulfuribacter thermophilus]|nr:hydrogenase iron-sulfur subunit [Dissulfuribacter thermophilus]